jgi:exonuclease III
MKHIRNDDVNIICTNMPQSPGKNKKQREEFYSYMENLNNDGFFSTIDVYKRHNVKLKENLPMLTFFSKRLKGRVERVDLFDKFEIEYDYTNERHKALKYIDVHFINDKRGGFYLINTYVRPKFWNRIMDDICMYLESFIIDYPYVICGDFNASVDETDIFEGDAAIFNDTMNDQGEYMEDFIFTYDLNDNGKNAGYTNLNAKTGKRTRIDYILSSGCSDNAIEGKVKTLSDSGVFSERGHPHVPLMFYDMERVRDDSGN